MTKLIKDLNKSNLILAGCRQYIWYRDNTIFVQWSHRVQWFLTCLHDYKEFNSLTDRGKLDGRGNLWEGFIPVRPLQIPWMLWCGYRKQEKVSIWRTPSLLHREFSWSFPARHWDQNIFSNLWWPCMRCEQESECFSKWQQIDQYPMGSCLRTHINHNFGKGQPKEETSTCLTKEYTLFSLVFSAVLGETRE